MLAPRFDLLFVHGLTVLRTVFLDAGGVLLFPNWTRIQAALAGQGVQVTADEIARAEPRARKQLDEQRTIGTTTDASRGWLFFDLILAQAGVARSARTAAALTELHAYHQANNLWELVPDGVRPALTRAPRSRAHACRRVERQRHAACAHGIGSASPRTSTSSSIHRTRVSRSRIPVCSRSRSDAPARALSRPSMSATCIRWMWSARVRPACARCCSTKPGCIQTPTATAWPRLRNWSNR